MKAKLNWLILEADLEQKEKHAIKCDDGSIVELWIGRGYNPNLRERNPCIAKVIHNGNEDYPHIGVGDLLVLHYNFFDNPNYLIEKEGSKAIYSIPLKTRDFNNQTQEWEWNLNYLIFGKIVDGEIIPLCENLICERVKMPSRSSVIIDPDPPTYTDRVKVLRVSPEIDEVKPGDIAMIHKMADYEVIFHYDGREKRAIKVAAHDLLLKL